MTVVDTRNTRFVSNDFLINQSSAGYYVNTPATPAAQNTQGTVFDGNTQQAQAANPECEDGQDDGHISLWSKLKNAVKGVGNFFKGLVCDENGNFSLGQTLKTVAIGVGVGALCVLTAGTAVPAIVATAGIAMSGYGLAKAGIQAAQAKTDAEAEAAWQSIGSNGTAFGLSLFGAKSLAKANAAAGVKGYSGNYDGITGTFRATLDVGKHAMSPVTDAFSAARLGFSNGGLSGAASELRTNISSQYKGFKGKVVENYNNTMYGVRGKYDKEIKDLEKQQKKLSKELKHHRKGSEARAEVQRQIDVNQAKIDAINEMKGITKSQAANKVIQDKETLLARKRAELATATDKTQISQLTTEVQSLEAQVQIQNEYYGRLIGEGRNLAADQKLEKGKGAQQLADKQAEHNFSTNARKVTESRMTSANTAVENAQSAVDAARVKVAEAQTALAEAKDAAAKAAAKAQLTTAEADLAAKVKVLDINQSQVNFFNRQNMAIAKGRSYSTTISELGRTIWNGFKNHRQDATLLRLTLMESGRNDEVEQKLANMLPIEQREQFFRLTAAQRHQIAQQVLAA